MLKMCLHTADLGNTAKPRYLYCRWVNRLLKEFYAQADKERKLGLPVSPIMDKKKNVDRSQVAFLDLIIRPLYVSWVEFLEDARICLKHVLTNRQYFYARIPSKKRR